MKIKARRQKYKNKQHTISLTKKTYKEHSFSGCIYTFINNRIPKCFKQYFKMDTHFERLQNEADVLKANLTKLNEELRNQSTKYELYALKQLLDCYHNLILLTLRTFTTFSKQRN